MCVGKFQIVHADEKLPFLQNRACQFCFYIVLLLKATVTNEPTPI